MLVLSVSMVFMPFVQEIQASHCESERKAAADAHDDWDIAVVAMTGAALAWGAACRRTPWTLACAAATVLLAAAVLHEQNCKKRFAEKNQAFNNCLLQHSGSAPEGVSGVT